MRLKFKIALVTVAFLISYFAWAKISSLRGAQKVVYAPSKKECFSGGQTRPYKYCIHVPADGKTNGQIAYSLHGRNLDEHTWNDDTYYTSMVQKYWTEHQLVPPTIVTVSFGPVWLLIPAGQKPGSGLLQVFTNEVIPNVEARVGQPLARILVGESMGGLNALIVGLTQNQMFRKVASLCPAVYIASPFASLEEMTNFIERTGADPKIIYGIVQLSKDYFVDEGEWKRASPIELIEKADPATAPEIYLSCGLYDAYGNYEGNDRLATRAMDRGFKIHWHPLYGGHCAMDINSLAEFLAQ